MKIICKILFFSILFSSFKIYNESAEDENKEHEAVDLDTLKLNVEEEKLKLNNDLKGVL